METTFTHNNLPEAVGQICQRLDSIELLLKKQEPQPEKDKQEFITLKQVCELTGYAAPTIYGLIGKNAIPHFKKGQRLFFEHDTIIAWIKEGKRKSKTEVEADADKHLQKLKIKR
jgi:predicted DNA-binding transcriptional regulator AlpA